MTEKVDRRKKADVDREALEIDYRLGIKSLRVLESEYGISDAAIRKLARKEGWTRDLNARIAAKREEMVREDMVRTSERAERLAHQSTKVAEREQVEIAAKTQADVILSHRKVIPKFKNLVEKLMGEVEFTTDNRELFEQLGELLRSEDQRGVDKLNDIYRKVIDLPNRVDSVKKLVETYKFTVGLERQAFGLSDNSNGDADTPKTPVASNPNDDARRVAFMLMQAAQAQKGAQK